MNHHDSAECQARWQKRYIIFSIVLMILVYMLSILLLINYNNNRHLSLKKETIVLSTPLGQINKSFALLNQAEARLAAIQKEIDAIQRQLHRLHHFRGECDEK